MDAAPDRRVKQASQDPKSSCPRALFLSRVVCVRYASKDIMRSHSTSHIYQGLGFKSYISNLVVPVITTNKRHLGAAAGNAGNAGLSVQSEHVMQVLTGIQQHDLQEQTPRASLQ